MFLFSASYFGWFFVIAVDFFDLCGGTGASIGARALRRSLRTIATKVSLFLASETLACPHELCSFVHVDLSGSCSAGGSVHSIRVTPLFVVPSRFPLFWGSRLLARLLHGISGLHA